MSKRKRISADQALQNVLQLFYEDSDEEESDMDELYAEEDFEDNDCIDTDAEQSPTRNVSSDDEIVEAPTERRKHRKKQLTYTRNVHSIETALCEENYDLLPRPTKEKIIKDEHPADSPSEKNKGKKSVSNNKKDKKEILFSNIPQKTTGCRNACNINFK